MPNHTHTTHTHTHNTHTHTYTHTLTHTTRTRTHTHIHTHTQYADQNSKLPLSPESQSYIQADNVVLVSSSLSFPENVYNYLYQVVYICFSVCFAYYVDSQLVKW